MSDATEKGGAMHAVIRTMKAKLNGYQRFDKGMMINEASKLATSRGTNKNDVMAATINAGKKQMTSPVKKK